MLEQREVLEEVTPSGPARSDGQAHLRAGWGQNHKYNKPVQVTDQPNQHLLEASLLDQHRPQSIRDLALAAASLPSHRLPGAARTPQLTQTDDA